MKNIYLKVLVVTVGMLLGFSACEKSEFIEDEAIVSAEANSLLEVRTRAGGDAGGAEVSYPVNVYVFKGNQCEAVQVISNEDETLSIPLVEGSYAVYAIGGASAEDYDLPSKTEATPAMNVALREGKSHGDVMVAKSNVTLVDGGTNVLTLSLERKTMLLQSISLSKIPTAATAVSVTISPLWEGIAGVGYTGEEGTATIQLTKQADGRTWAFSGSTYLLPPAGTTANIAVNVVKSDGTKSYTYSIADQLKAGDKIAIQGTYTEAVGVTLTGTVTGAAAWTEKTISFEFNESGSTSVGEGNDSGDDNNDDNGNGDDNDDDNNGNDNNDGDILAGPAPAVGATYQTCYVLSASEDNGVVTVVLLSPKEKTIGLVNKEESASAMTKVEAALPSCSVDGITGWRLMTREEAQVLFKASSKPKSLDDNRYLFIDGGTIKVADFGNLSFSPATNLSSTDLLRPVATVKIYK